MIGIFVPETSWIGMSRASCSAGSKSISQNFIKRYTKEGRDGDDRLNEEEILVEALTRYLQVLQSGEKKGICLMFATDRYSIPLLRCSRELTN
jgi:hypothetical protein